MRLEFLGDSYDIVKRFWAKSLEPRVPLYAHWAFMPENLQPDFTQLTGIHVLKPDDIPRRPFRLLLDPDTGIPLATAKGQRLSAKHAPLEFIVGVVEELRPKYLICYDQSHHRGDGRPKVEQLTSKQQFLEERKIASFYYRSHAPFLFMSKSGETIKSVYAELRELGIPDEMLGNCVGC